MIVDFHHHFTPRELINEDPGDRLILAYDENGAPAGALSPGSPSSALTATGF
jgi:hypothetical protein